MRSVDWSSAVCSSVLCAGATGSDQGGDAGGGPGRGLGGKRVEAAPDDWHGIVIGDGDPGVLVERRISRDGGTAGDLPDQVPHLAKLRDLATGIGKDRRQRGGLMRHGPRFYRVAAKEGLMSVVAAAPRR